MHALSTLLNLISNYETRLLSFHLAGVASQPTITLLVVQNQRNQKLR